MLRYLRSGILFALSFSSAACAAAHAHSANGQVNWNKECSEKCKDPMEIIVYSPDGTAVTHFMALYSLNPPTGCLCPAPLKKAPPRK